SVSGRIPRTLCVPRPPVQAGDLEVADVLQDVPDAEQRLLHAALQLSELGVPLTQDAVDRAPRVAELVGGVLADAGLPPADLVVSGQPRALRDGDRVVVEVGHAGCYVAAEGRSLHLGPTLRRWATRPLDGTAFAALYGEPGAPPPAADAAVRSPLPLTPAQEAAVLDARTQPVSVLSGAPGTGKSHAAVAIALDEVARGGAVLLATRSGHAAEVLAGL